MNSSDFIESTLNKCECRDNGTYRIIRQRGKEVYNAYKSVAPKNKTEKISQYSSVKKIVVRVEISIDEDTGKEVKTNVMGAKEYKTLKAAISDCEKDSKKNP